jgi:hypothetical protein
MATLKTGDDAMTIDKLHNKSMTISDIIDGHLVTHVYYGYTKRQAIRLFKEKYLTKA